MSLEEGTPEWIHLSYTCNGKTHVALVNSHDSLGSSCLNEIKSVELCNLIVSTEIEGLRNSMADELTEPHTSNSSFDKPNLDYPDSLKEEKDELKNSMHESICNVESITPKDKKFSYVEKENPATPSTDNSDHRRIKNNIRKKLYRKNKKSSLRELTSIEMACILIIISLILVILITKGSHDNSKIRKDSQITLCSNTELKTNQNRFIPLELINGWTPFGEEYSEPAFFISNNIVTVQGSIQNTHHTRASGEVKQIAQLPAGARPSHKLTFLCSSTGISRIDVYPNGTISNNGGWNPFNIFKYENFLSLDCIHFVVAQNV